MGMMTASYFRQHGTFSLFPLLNDPTSHWVTSGLFTVCLFVEIVFIRWIGCNICGLIRFSQFLNGKFKSVFLYCLTGANLYTLIYIYIQSPCTLSEELDPLIIPLAPSPIIRNSMCVIKYKNYFFNNFIRNTWFLFISTNTIV